MARLSFCPLAGADPKKIIKNNKKGKKKKMLEVQVDDKDGISAGLVLSFSCTGIAEVPNNCRYPLC